MIESLAIADRREEYSFVVKLQITIEEGRQSSCSRTATVIILEGR